MDAYSIMPFGKYKGEAMANVPYKYLKWLWDTEACSGELKEYIKDNAEIIGIEL